MSGLDSVTRSGTHNDLIGPLEIGSLQTCGFDIENKEGVDRLVALDGHGLNYLSRRWTESLGGGGRNEGIGSRIRIDERGSVESGLEDRKHAGHN